MHNGAFVHLEDAIRYHLDATAGSGAYSTALLPADLRGAPGPSQPVLDRLDPRLRTPVRLDEDELDALVDFVRNGLLDPAAAPQRLRRLIPQKLPGGRVSLIFR
jgi:hypothetical protein